MQVRSQRRVVPDLTKSVLRPMSVRLYRHDEDCCHGSLWVICQDMMFTAKSRVSLAGIDNWRGVGAPLTSGIAPKIDCLFWFAGGTRRRETGKYWRSQFL